MRERGVSPTVIATVSTEPAYTELARLQATAFQCRIERLAVGAKAIRCRLRFRNLLAP
jgi:hypothetical protein